MGVPEHSHAYSVLAEPVTGRLYLRGASSTSVRSVGHAARGGWGGLEGCVVDVDQTFRKTGRSRGCQNGCPLGCIGKRMLSNRLS